MKSDQIVTPLEAAKTGRAGLSNIARSPKNGSKEAEEARPSHKPEIGLSGSVRAAVNRILSHSLADANVLVTKTRNFHWNLVGPSFLELHRLLDEQYEALAKDADEIAERIRMLGGVAPGSMAEFLGLATLKEAPGAKCTPETAIAGLLADHESVIRALRKNIDFVQDELKDMGTGDFLIKLMQNHEATAWMLRSYLE